MANEDIQLFRKTGFFEERDLAVAHLRDVDDILFSAGVDYCVFYGTLLGLLRHDDFIPWDDDMDIIIFDNEKFERTCRHQFEDRGYVIYDDIRDLEGTEVHCGYRIHSELGLTVPGQTWKFPWVGVFRPRMRGDAMVLPPEENTFTMDDFFPLERKAFLDFTVSTPRFTEKILKEYFGDDCMTMCLLHGMDHRKYKPTGFPTTKFPVREVLAYLNNTA